MEKHAVVCWLLAAFVAKIRKFGMFPSLIKSSQFWFETIGERGEIYEI
jgi:hypothetical protein